MLVEDAQNCKRIVSLDDEEGSLQASAVAITPELPGRGAWLVIASSKERFMKKQIRKKLSLSRETLRGLEEGSFKDAVGGATAQRTVCGSCPPSACHPTLCCP